MLVCAETDAAARQQQPVPGHAVRGGQDGAHAERLQQRPLAAVAAPQHDPQRLIYHHPQTQPTTSPHPLPSAAFISAGPGSVCYAHQVALHRTAHHTPPRPHAHTHTHPVPDWTRKEIRKVAASPRVFSRQLRPAALATRGGGKRFVLAWRRATSAYGQRCNQGGRPPTCRPAVDPPPCPTLRPLC